MSCVCGAGGGGGRGGGRGERERDRQTDSDKTERRRFGELHETNARKDLSEDTLCRSVELVDWTRSPRDLCHTQKRQSAPL